jgi:hypothetical protein
VRHGELEAYADQQREQRGDEQQQLVAAPEKGDPQLVGEKTKGTPNDPG